jgi:tRNA pseudouridine65 synthase
MNLPEEPLNILYQDEWFVAVDKPAGQLVHPADVPQEDDQVTMKILRDQIGKLVYNIHRIDRPTTGVLLFGIDRGAARALHRALERHEIKKTYWAVVSGQAPSEPWECKEPSQKADDAPLREAHTSFNTRGHTTLDCLQDAENPTLSLIEARPHTGRFHQIRRHLLHQGLPIVGDYRYAGIETSNSLGSLLGTGTRMLLQSKSLSFTHPVTEEETNIEAPVEPNFLKCFPKLT